MSRIHEALQRAYRERGKLPVLDDEQVAELNIASAHEEPLLVKPNWYWKTCAASVENRMPLPFPRSRIAAQASSSFAASARASTRLTLEAAMKTIVVAAVCLRKKKLCRGEFGHEHGAQHVNNILLIDGDLRRPRFMISWHPIPRLSDYLEVLWGLRHHAGCRSSKYRDTARISSPTSPLSLLAKPSRQTLRVCSQSPHRRADCDSFTVLNWIVIDFSSSAGGYRRGRSCQLRDAICSSCAKQVRVTMWRSAPRPPLAIPASSALC